LGLPTRVFLFSICRPEDINFVQDQKKKYKAPHGESNEHKWRPAFSQRKVFNNTFPLQTVCLRASARLASLSWPEDDLHGSILPSACAPKALNSASHVHTV